MNDMCLVSPKKAAEFLELKVSTLASWRCLGVPHLPYIKYGHRVKYDMNELRKFKASRMQVID